MLIFTSPLVRLAVALCGFIIVVDACGGGGAGSAVGSGAIGAADTASPPAVPAVVPLPAPQPFPQTAASGDDWTTFAHDYQRTGYQPQNTGITPLNVASLTLRWKTNVGAEVYPSPLVYNGNVVITALTGTVYDLSVKDGTILWQRQLGGEVRATPSIDGVNSLVFVPNRLADGAGNPLPSWMFALRLIDGTVAWQTQLDSVTHGSPVAANGTVYVGTAGGDPETGCHSGGVTALTESSGVPVWSWKVNPNSGGGGSSWGALSYDGSHIILGTGNVCQNPWPTANGVVALNPNDTLDWAFAAVNNPTFDQDDDTGSGVALWYGRATFMSKNGTLYTVNAATGKIVWSMALGAADQQGGFTTPTTNGTMVFAGAGLIRSSTASSVQRSARRNDWTRRHPKSTAAGYLSYLRALDAYGHILWSKPMNNWNVGYVAATQGLVFAALDNQLVALDPGTGTVLWSYVAPNIFEASPVIVPSGVYAADASGNVYAFALPSR